MKKINAPFIRNPYNYDTNEHSDATGLLCPEPTLTQQQFKEESDINYIAERYGLTGEAPHIEGMMWGQEFVGLFDFQAAHNQLIEAKRQFMELPAKTRDRFLNDPARLIAFLEDPDNRDEAVKLGLVNRAAIEPQSRVDDLAAPDRANPAPDPDKPLDRSTPKPDKKTKNDT